MKQHQPTCNPACDEMGHYLADGDRLLETMVGVETGPPPVKNRPVRGGEVLEAPNVPRGTKRAG